MSHMKLKLVIVGDGACGKTCLVEVFQHDEFVCRYVPTVFETYVKELTLDGKDIELLVYDTGGQEDYDKLRPKVYPKSDVILVCYSVDSPNSYSNVKYKWVPEVKRACSGVPVIIVGLKTDLREDANTIKKLEKQGRQPITLEQGRKMASETGTAEILECSALKYDGVQEVFEAAVRAAMARRRQRRKLCAIL